MRSLTTNLMIAAVTVVAAAGSASAQILKADIPFTFRTGKTLMKPGNYDIRIGQFDGYVVFRNRDTAESAVIARYVRADPAKDVKAAGTPKLRLRCVESHCILLDMWTGSDSAYVFPPSKLGRDDLGQITEIRLSATKAD